MTPLLILTHGDFGPLLLQAAQGMYGPQEAVAALGLGPDETREAFLERVRAAAAGLKAPPLVLVDLACGTPWNSALLAGLGEQGEVLAGLSLPLLLEALGLRAAMEPRSLALELSLRGPQCFARASHLMARGEGGCA
jgi:mannose/fructose-specific phosphotransferase system component IIA